MPTGRVLLGAMLGQQARRARWNQIKQHRPLCGLHADTDQEEVAFLFRKYALVEAPVVNDEGVNPGGHHHGG
jgi:Mg/Co/Ni transporter MgtE